MTSPQTAQHLFVLRYQPGHLYQWAILVSLGVVFLDDTIPALFVGERTVREMAGDAVLRDLGQARSGDYHNKTSLFSRKMQGLP